MMHLVVKCGPFPASFYLFCLFSTVDNKQVNKQIFNINFPMTGVEPRTSGMNATALPTEPQPLPMHLVVKLAYLIGTYLRCTVQSRDLHWSDIYLSIAF